MGVLGPNLPCRLLLRKIWNLEQSKSKKIQTEIKKLDQSRSRKLQRKIKKWTSPDFKSGAAILFSMHSILFQHLYLSLNLLHTDHPTDWPTDIVTYKATIAAKHKRFETHWSHLTKRNTDDWKLVADLWQKDANDLKLNADIRQKGTQMIWNSLQTFDKREHQQHQQQ